MELSIVQVLIGILVVFIVYVFLIQNTEHLDNVNANAFTTLYLQPSSMFTEASSAPSDYSKNIEVSAKECSDNSSNQQIFDYQLSMLNQTKK